jgi:hypothetical protein
MASTKAIDTYVERAQSGEFAAVFLPGMHILKLFYNCNANIIVYICVYIYTYIFAVIIFADMFILIRMKICI